MMNFAKVNRIMEIIAVYKNTIYNVYKNTIYNAPNIDPWGTPQLTSLSSELKLLSDKLCSVFKIRRKSIICLTSNTIVFNFWIRIAWSTVSKAFWKSTKTPQPFCPLSSCSRIFSVRWIRAWLVKCFCRNPNCRL